MNVSRKYSEIFQFSYHFFCLFFVSLLVCSKWKTFLLLHNFLSSSFWLCAFLLFVASCCAFFSKNFLLPSVQTFFPVTYPHTLDFFSGWETVCESRSVYVQLSGVWDKIKVQWVAQGRKLMESCTGKTKQFVFFARVVPRWMNWCMWKVLLKGTLEAIYVPPLCVSSVFHVAKWYESHSI